MRPPRSSQRRIEQCALRDRRRQTSRRQRLRSAPSPADASSTVKHSSSMTGSWLVEPKLGHKVRHVAPVVPLMERHCLGRPDFNPRQGADEDRVSVDRSHLAQVLGSSSRPWLSSEISSVWRTDDARTPDSSVLARRSFKFAAELRPGRSGYMARQGSGGAMVSTKWSTEPRSDAGGNG